MCATTAHQQGAGPRPFPRLFEFVSSLHCVLIEYFCLFLICHCLPCFHLCNFCFVSEVNEKLYIMNCTR